MQILTPTTELEAVNQMLATIMEAPINTVAGAESLDAQLAISTLQEVSRDIQTPGWPFNSEVAYPLLADPATGEVKLPLNCLSVDGILDEGLDLVQRGGRLYDRANHTFAIRKTVKVDMTVLLDFSELPEAARRFAAIKASRLFQKRGVGSTTIDGFTAEDEDRARIAFKRAMGQAGDHNIFNGPGMDRILSRR